MLFGCFHLSHNGNVVRSGITPSNIFLNLNLNLKKIEHMCQEIHFIVECVLKNKKYLHHDTWL